LLSMVETLGNGTLGNGTGRLLRVALDAEQLDVEEQGRARADVRRRAVIAVGGGGRAHQPALAADLHVLHAFGPAGYDGVERDGGRLAARHRAVDHFAVGERAVIVDLDHVGGLGGGAGAFVDRGDDHAGFHALGAGLG